MSTIALTCPSSFTSWNLARFLLRRGHDVRLLCRTVQPVEPLMELGAQIVDGNLQSPSMVRTLLQGADAVYIVTPGSGRAGDPYEINIAHVLAGAIAASDVEHVVYLSALGAHRPGAVQHLQTKAAIEQILLDTGRDVSCLRPGVFMDNLWLARRALDRGVLAMPMHPSSTFPAVAARDVAVAALQIVTHGPDGCKAYDMPGSRPVTPSGLAALLEQAWGRPISYSRLGEAEFRSHLMTLDLSERRASLLTRILVDYDNHLIEGDHAGWQNLCLGLGIRPTPIENFVQDLAHGESVPPTVREAAGKHGELELAATSVGRGTPSAWTPGRHTW